MPQSILEKTLVDFAYKHNYTINERVSREDLMNEVEVKSQLGEKPNILAKRQGILNKRNFFEVEAESQPDFKRYIFTPTGAIEYKCWIDFNGKRSPYSAKEINEAIKQNQYPFEILTMYHGEVIDKWKDENLPLSQRIKDWRVEFSLTSEDQKPIYPKDVEVYIRLEPTHQDPVYEFLEGFLRFPDFEGKSRQIKSNDFLAKLNERDFGGMPHPDPAPDFLLGDNQLSWLPKISDSYEAIFADVLSCIDGTAYDPSLDNLGDL